MSDYDNNMRGALFKNDRRRGPNSPNYTGSAEIDGVEYWVSAWVKKSRRGETFLSLAFTNKEEFQAASAADELSDEDIPF